MIKDRIKEIRETDLGMNKNQFSKALGVPNGYISNWESGKGNPGTEFYTRIKRLIPKINEYWIRTGKGTKYITEAPRGTTLKAIPIYRNIPCGVPTDIFNDEGVDTIEIGGFSPQAIGVEAMGNSNLPVIKDKDILIGEPIQKPKNRDIVITNFKTSPELLNANIKLFQNLSKTEFLLIPINSEFPTTRHFYTEVYSFYKAKKLLRDIY